MKKLELTGDLNPPMQMNHLAIKSTDVTRLAEFYQSILGLPRIRTFTDETGLRSIWLSLEASILMIERSDFRTDSDSKKSEFRTDNPGYHLLAFTVSLERQQSLKRKLVEAGTKIEHESEYTVYFRDPDGNRVGLSCLDTSSVTNSE